MPETRNAKAMRYITYTMLWKNSYDARVQHLVSGGSMPVINAINDAIDGTTNLKCTQSINRWRVADWTAWARFPTTRREKIDLGLGSEYCIKMHWL